MLLAECHRRCCICHRFCGIRIETHHIIPENEGGNNNISNAIPVCFDCHAEVQLYNNKHPRGRKYTANELREHKKRWLKLCKSSQFLKEDIKNANKTLFSGIINELEYNLKLLDLIVPLENRQFHQSIDDGTISLLDDTIKNEIMSIYSVIKVTNEEIINYNQKKNDNAVLVVLKLSENELNRKIIITKEGINNTLNLITESIID
jgi:hypothetical protein